MALIVSLIAPFLAGWFGSQFKPGEWYLALQKPSWTPPGWLFPIAWTALYAMMGVAAWLVWKKRVGNDRVPFALGLFAAQLVLNALWSWIFFGRHAIGGALLEISALWLTIAATLIAFWRITPVAGALLLPYLLWVSFATALNAAIWKMN